MVLLVFACMRPVVPRTKLTPKDVKRAIQQTHNVCHNSDDTPACRVMWDRVNELSHALARQEELKAEQEPDLWDELETREYDV
jgi:hypothetical protein